MTRRVSSFPHGVLRPLYSAGIRSALSLAPPAKPPRLLSSSSSSTSEPRAALALLSVGYSSPATVHNSCCACATNRASASSSAPRPSSRSLPLVSLPFSCSWRTIATVSVLPSSLSLAQLVLRVRRAKYAFRRASFDLRDSYRVLRLPLTNLPPRVSIARAAQRGSTVSFCFLEFPFSLSVPLYAIRQTPGGVLRLTKARFCRS